MKYSTQYYHSPYNLSHNRPISTQYFTNFSTSRLWLWPRNRNWSVHYLSVITS